MAQFIEEDSNQQISDKTDSSEQENMLSPSEAVSRMSSRLHRLSTSLPKLNTHSKIHKDPPRPAFASDFLASGQQETSSTSSPLPPTRSPPVAPIHAKTPSSGTSTPIRLQNYATSEQVSCRTPESSHAHKLSLEDSGSNSLLPPQISEIAAASNNIALPSAMSIRPASRQSEGEKVTAAKRKSWLPMVSGKPKSQNPSADMDADGFSAWLNAGEHKILYSSNLLNQGERVPELWNEGPEADTFVYLFPIESGHGPQFKILSIALSASQPLTQLMYGDLYSGRLAETGSDERGYDTIEDSTRNLAIQNSTTPPYTPKPVANGSENHSTSGDSNESILSFPEGPKEIHLYFPTGLSSSGAQLSAEDSQKLIDIRNLFAFLHGQPLVSTPARPTNFDILLSIASRLEELQFTNFDGSTFGEAVIASTKFIMEDLMLSDVRESLDKNIQTLVLSEKLRSAEIYNEAFAHAAGNYDKLEAAKSCYWDHISPATLNKLQRASIDLKSRINSVMLRLTDFEFPSIFTGIGASTSSPEAKLIRFKYWKTHFMLMRKQTMSYYKNLHGSWPPKVNHKKNKFQQGGLNRLVLKGLYNDLCGVYDYLADRTSFTSRSMAETDDKTSEDQNLVHAALRKLLSEYDRSSPPVQPPVPYDVPLEPDISTVEPGFHNMSPKEQHQHLNRRLKDAEMTLILTKTYNLKSDHNQPFLDMYKVFEAKEAKRMSILELTEMRYGHWIFIYAVLQALPLLVMDVPDLRQTQGVESFLCMPPLGGFPWVEDYGAVKMSWYGVQGGQGVVSLPSDVVNYGVEATYRRSHCWTIADKWLSGQINDDSSLDGNHERDLSPLSPPPGFAGGELGLRPSVRRRDRDSYSSQISTFEASHKRRSGSRQHLQSQRNSIALGLERLPIPTNEDQGLSPMPGFGSRPGTSGSGRPMTRGTSPMSSCQAHSRRASSHARLLSSEYSTPELKGSTFDDILGSMENGKVKKNKLVKNKS